MLRSTNAARSPAQPARATCGFTRRLFFMLRSVLTGQCRAEFFRSSTQLTSCPTVLPGWRSEDLAAVADVAAGGGLYRLQLVLTGDPRLHFGRLAVLAQHRLPVRLPAALAALGA